MVCTFPYLCLLNSDRKKKIPLNVYCCVSENFLLSDNSVRLMIILLFVFQLQIRVIIVISASRDDRFAENYECREFPLFGEFLDTATSLACTLVDTCNRCLYRNLVQLYN